MLLERTTQLIDRVNRFSLLQESASDSKDFSERGQTLDKITKELNKITTMVELFRQQGFDIDVNSSLNYAHTLFEKLKLKWVEDENSIIRPHDFFTKVRLANIEQSIKEKLEERWQEYVKEKRPSINISQLNTLANIPDLRAIVNEFKEHLERLNRIKEHFPNQEADFIYIVTLTEEMKRLWGQLQSQNIPPEVMKFIKEAGTADGVNLAEITPEIIKWLKENNLIHLCQVRFGK